MISRYYLTCAVCKTHHTLRVQIGYGDEQRHRFQCHHCNEPIAVGLLSEKIEVAGAHLTDATKGADGQTSYQYLSPDFVADSAKARDPMYFGSMDLMGSLLKTPKVQKYLAKRHKGQLPPDSWFALSNAVPDWEKLQVCWRLERSGKYFLAVENLALFDREAGTSSWLAAVRFGHRLFGANENLLTEARKLLKQNDTEASRLVVEHGYRWTPDFMESEFQVFNEFFKRWDAFSQVYLYVQNNVLMPRVPTATSVDFEHVRGFYLSAQEFFAKQIGLLTALSNIGAGRSFDRLNHISLEKYFSTDNAKRRDNFQHNASFWSATSEYDSGLRNAEAHNWLKASAETQRLHYLQSGNGAIVELRYVDYLQKSVLLFRQICHLMQLEALLRRVSLQGAYKLLSAPQLDMG
jgi:hypothetical protein